MQNNPQSEAIIREMLDGWTKALAAKDLDEMHKNYAAGYRIFDVKETADGAEGVRALWEGCFPYFDTPRMEYKNLTVHATDDMAFIHFYSRMSGMKDVPPDSDMAKSWLRGTVCYRKDENGRWKVLHEHISFPVDCETERVAPILDEQDKAA